MDFLVPVGTALFGGAISFLSPCVLPLVPGYISFVSGTSLTDLSDPERRARAERSGHRRRIFFRTLAFVAGFSVVFVVLGASATYIGHWLGSNRVWFDRVAGTAIILFGLHTMGVLRIGFLNMEKRYHAAAEPVGLLGSFGIGVAFAFGWSPCIGPILAGVLTLAGSRETVQEGVVLLSFYSAGLGLPFLLTGLMVDRFLAVSSKLKRHMRKIEIVAGALLVVVGILVATSALQQLATYLTFLPWLG